MGLLIVYEGALDSLHKKIFGISMGPSTISFLRQLHWSILGGIVASLILFLVSASAARILGTDQYGKYNFLIAIAQFISLCITWSFELAIVRALAFTQEDKASQQYIISSSLVFLLVTITVINLIALFIPISFSKSLVMLFASILAMKALADGIIRGLGLFGYQAIGK
ncbi:MAG TPA: oligosaccharide flippase family protein, partial [Candidatus Andersenbacteria bacterium]|nr:oligosaccharide flippase family protein [Candidatus Andersenbacteria bacterium]